MRVAVWGLGPHAFKNVLPAIELSPGLELAGVHSRDTAKRERARAEWGGTAWATPEAMLASETLDAVYVATPTGLHFDHGMAVLHANKHLICEKSLVTNLAQAQALVAAASARERVLCEALAYQFHPRIAQLQSLVASDDFGPPLHAFCTFGLPPLQQPGFRTDAVLGGGALLDVGCYPLSMMRVVLGDHARVDHADLRFDLAGAVDLSGSARVSFAREAMADVSWGYNRAYTADLIVIGERQSVYANRLFSKETVAGSSIVVRNQSGQEHKFGIPAANGFVNLLQRVADASNSSQLRETFYRQAESQARLLGEVITCAR